MVCSSSILGTRVPYGVSDRDELVQKRARGSRNRPYRKLGPGIGGDGKGFIGALFDVKQGTISRRLHVGEDEAGGVELEAAAVEPPPGTEAGDWFELYAGSAQYHTEPDATTVSCESSDTARPAAP